MIEGEISARGVLQKGVKARRVRRGGNRRLKGPADTAQEECCRKDVKA